MSESVRDAARFEALLKEIASSMPDEASAEQIKSGFRKTWEKPPLEALPGCVIFFFRTVDMLQGMCARLRVGVPFMQPMAIHARRFLLEQAAARLPPPTPSVHPPHAPPPPHGGRAALRRSGSGAMTRLLAAPSTPLQDRVAHLMHALAQTGSVAAAPATALAEGAAARGTAGGGASASAHALASVAWCSRGSKSDRYRSRRQSRWQGRCGCTRARQSKL